MSDWIKPKPESPKDNLNKPSRWWMIYHFWGGVCLNAYVNVSGLSKLLLGAPSGSDHASASSYAGSAAMIAVGAVALGYYLSKILINSISGSALPNKGKISLKIVFPIIYFILAIFLAMVTEPLIAKSESVQKTSSSNSNQPAMKPVMAFTTTQSSEGAKEADLDQAGLEGLEAWIVETMLKKGRNKFAEMGYDPKNFKPDLSANSVYITAEGKKLAVIKVNMDNSMRSVTLIGIQGAELLRVSCIRASNHDISVWSGECGDEVRKTFGVSIQP